MPETLFTHETRNSAKTRRQLADDVMLGGGNVLAAAVAHSPRSDLPFLLTEIPVTHVDGSTKRLFSLTELDELAQAWSVWYLERGISPRERVAVYVQDSFEDLLQFFALSQIGAIPVLINGRMPAELAAGLCQRTGVVGLYADAERAQRLSAHLGGTGASPKTRIVNSEVGAVPRRRLSDTQRYRHHAEDPVFICHSSGTTGVPKAVIWTHRQSIEGIRSLLRAPIGERMSLVPREAAGAVGVVDAGADAQVLLSAVPQSHSAGVSFAAGALLFGTPIVVLSDISGGHVVDAIEQYRPTDVVAFSATYAEIATLAPDPRRLASVGTWFNTGDSAHARHIEPLVNAGHRWIDGQRRAGSAFVDGLGSSELGFAQFLRITTADSLRHDRCVGKPHVFAEPTVLRKDGTVADPYEVGFLAVKSPTVTPGYWNDSDTTYRSRVGEYWLSGDVVYRDEADFFYHMDRAVDVIHTAQGPAYSLLMEEILLAHVPEIVDCAIVAAPNADAESPVAIVLLRGGSAEAHELMQRANRILREKMQPELEFLDIAKDPQDVPLGPTGKVLKRVLRERYKNLFAGGGSEYASGYVPDLTTMNNATSETSRVDH